MLMAIVLMGNLGLANNPNKSARSITPICKMVPGDIEEGIDFFNGSWEQALKKSSKEDKLIFLDAYAAWCGPCKMMAKRTFTKEAVGEFFNANFVNYKMDMEKHPEGPRLSKKFELEAYPSLYFLDKNEKIVHFTLGYHQASDLIEVGKLALSKKR